jgi:flagellar biosynthetic protein FliR
VPLRGEKGKHPDLNSAFRTPHSAFPETPLVSFLLQLYLNQFILFVLVLTRISGLVMTAPIYGSNSVPLRIRGFLAVGLAMMITPTQNAEILEVPEHLVGIVIMMGRELVLGLALGLAVMILFTGLQLAGQIIGQTSGMSLADVFDPTLQTNIAVFSQLLDIITLSVFLTIGGHRQVLHALLDTFRWRPPGGDGLPARLIDIMTTVTSESFLIGIRVGAPVMVALMLAIVILGLISRTLPQLNILAVGFSLNSFIMLMTLSFSLGAIAWVVQERADVIIESVHAVLIEQ